MYRCASATLAVALAASAALFATSGIAQVQRNFPANALRGELVVGDPPEVKLNGLPTTLAPGARIRGQNNMLQMSGGLSGSKLAVHYTLDSTGQLRDVWVLTADELAKRPWPKTALEADAWVFDFGAQTWSKP